MNKLGLYFGTFGPPHIGHLGIIKASLEYCDSIIVIPSAQSPEKLESLGDSQKRLEMMELMIESEGLRDRVLVSPIEFNLPKPSYTVMTLRKIKTLHPEAELILIMGSDNWMKLDTWFRADEVIELVDFLVYPRNGDMLTGGTKVTVLDVPEINISSSQIRSMGREELRETPWVVQEVKDYILNHELYNA